jgi:hypothetical protein
MWWRRLALLTFLSQDEYSIFGHRELGLVPDGDGYWIQWHPSNMRESYDTREEVEES